MTHFASIAPSGFDENSDDVPKGMPVRREMGAEGCSMRHQGRNRHRGKDFSRHTPSTNSRGREKAVGRIALAASEAAPLGCTAVLPRGTSHCRGRYFRAGGRLPRFPRFGLGALPVKLTRSSLAHSLRRPAPSSRPLDRAVDQNPDQQDWTYDLHDGEQGHGLNGVEHAFFSKGEDVWP